MIASLNAFCQPSATTKPYTASAANRATSRPIPAKRPCFPCCRLHPDCVGWTDAGCLAGAASGGDRLRVGAGNVIDGRG
jgi:hypothetical protein